MVLCMVRFEAAAEPPLNNGAVTDPIVVPGTPTVMLTAVVVRAAKLAICLRFPVAPEPFGVPTMVRFAPLLVEVVPLAAQFSVALNLIWIAPPEM